MEINWEHVFQGAGGGGLQEKPGEDKGGRAKRKKKKHERVESEKGHTYWDI